MTALVYMWSMPRMILCREADSPQELRVPSCLSSRSSHRWQQDRSRDSPRRGDSAEPNGTANGKDSNGDASHKGDDDAAGSEGDGGKGEGGDDKDSAMSEAAGEDPQAVSAEA